MQCSVIHDHHSSFLPVRERKKVHFGRGESGSTNIFMLFTEVIVICCTLPEMSPILCFLRPKNNKRTSLRAYGMLQSEGLHTINGCGKERRIVIGPF